MAGTPAHIAVRLTWLLSWLPLAACAPAPADTLDRVRAEGFIRAGFTPEAPYALLDSTGRVGGESPEALRRAMEGIGVDSIRWILLDFEELIPALRDGRVDVVAAGMFETPARRERVRFSRPTLCARPALIYRAGAPVPSGLTAFVSAAGGRLAVVEGAVEHEAARALGVPADRILAVPDLATGVAAVRRGNANALALTTPTLRNVVKGDTTLAWTVYEAPAAVASLVGGCSALAFRLADVGLAEAVDHGLADYVGSPRHAGVLEGLGVAQDEAPPAAHIEGGDR